MTLWRHRDAWAWPCSGHSHDALGSAPGFCSMGPAKRLLQGLRRQLCNPWQGCVSEVCTSSEALGIYHVIRLFFQNMNMENNGSILDSLTQCHGYVSHACSCFTRTAGRLARTPVHVNKQVLCLLDCATLQGYKLRS